MTLFRLKPEAAVLQRAETSRKGSRAKAILDLYERAAQAVKDDVLGFSEEVLLDRAAAGLYSDEASYLQALEKLQGVNPGLIDEARVRKSVFAKYIVEKYDFSKTSEVTDKFFDDSENFEAFLGKVRAYKDYIYIEDSVLKEVYDMLCTKYLVR